MSTVCVLPGTEYLHSTGGTVLGYFHSCIYSSILCVIYIRLVLGYFHSCIHSSTTPSTQAVSVLINASSLRDELYGHDETKIPNSNAARRFGHAMPTAIGTRGQKKKSILKKATAHQSTHTYMTIWDRSDSHYMLMLRT